MAADETRPVAMGGDSSIRWLLRKVEYWQWVAACC